MKGKKLALLLSLIAITSMVPNNVRAVSSSSKTDVEITSTVKPASSSTYSTKTDIDINKDWTITFNKAVSLSSLDKSLITVKDSYGNKVNVTLVSGGKSTQILVKAPSGGYDYNKTYTLTVAKGKYGKLNLKKDYTVKFTTKAKGKTNEQLANEIYGDINLAHQVYLDYVKDTQHDKDHFILWETMNNFKDFEEYAKGTSEFLSKYCNNSKYANVTDLDYYKNIKGLTINFDKVNNSNRILREPAPYAANYYMSSSKQYYFNQVNPYLTAIWRPDTSKEILDEINKQRANRGLKELKIDPDLTAIAMWGAKRSYINQVRDMTIQPLYLGEDEGAGTITYNNPAFLNYVDITKTAEVTGHYTWNRYEILHGTTPMVPKETESWTTGATYSGSTKLYYNTQLERDLTQYFNYKKPIRLINYATQYDYNGERIVKRLSERNRIGRDNSSTYRLANYCTNRVFNDEIYNSKVENIGVGVIYEKAYNGMYNGNFVIYIIVS